MSLPGSILFKSPVASTIPFDNTASGLVATDVQAAIEESVNFSRTSEVMVTAVATTSSTTDALMDSMTVTPPQAGTYLVLFNTDVNSATAGAAISVSYYVAGVQVAASLRKIIPFDGGALSAGAARGIAALQDIIVVTGSQAIEVRWSISSGTATAAARSLITLRVA